jgi:hypothetical protein
MQLIDPAELENFSGRHTVRNGLHEGDTPIDARH